MCIFAQEIDELMWKMTAENEWWTFHQAFSYKIYKLIHLASCGKDGQIDELIMLQNYTYWERRTIIIFARVPGVEIPANEKRNRKGTGCASPDFLL